VNRTIIAALALCGTVVVSAGAPSPIAPAGSSAVPCSLSLRQCFALAKDNNASLRSALAAVQVTKGENLVVLSRLLPHLNLLYEGAWQDSAGATNDLHDKGLSLQLSQRVAEFGPTSESEYARLRGRRATLLANENTIVGVSSFIRTTYFTLRIIQDQLGQHDSLYGIYAVKLEQTESRLQQGVGHKFEAFAARLNCLDERERILDLRQKQHAQMARLKELLGFVRAPDSVRLTTTAVGLSLPIDSCIAFAMRNNTEVAEAQDEARLVKRHMLETGWELAPDLSISAGWQKDKTGAGLQLSNSRPDAAHRWALDVVGTQRLVTPVNDPPLGQPFSPSLSAYTDTALRYTAMITVEFPLLQGGKRVGQGIEEIARYEQARNDLIAKTRELERSILETYYGYQTILDQLKIQQERVAIDRERYSLAETMKEMGKLTEGEMDDFRSRVFSSQDAFFALQFRVLDAEENLRAQIRQFE
jgi:outer membrane protein TolC